MRRFIFTGFSPNTRGIDAWLALKLLPTLFFPRKNFAAVKKIEDWFREYFSLSHAIAFDSGRSALEKVLLAVGIYPGDEVIIQGFTCVVVANAITNLGAVPIYADCAPAYSLDPESVKNKISAKTKAIIVQHTFGAPANMDKLMEMAYTNNLVVIEDCAHSLGGQFGGRLLGTFGTAAIFSFGSDKVISGVRGGMAITNNAKIGERLKKIQIGLAPLPWFRELQHLLHPIFFWLGKNIYHLYIGKIILFLAAKFRLLNRIIYQPEKKGIVPSWFPAQLPNSLATLAFEQIKNLDSWNQKRQDNTAFYLKALKNKKSVQSLGSAEMWLRFPVEVENPREFKIQALKKNIILGDWYARPIAPSDSSAVSARYAAGSCPRAEISGAKIINLPTDPSLSPGDLQRVVELF